MDQQASHWLLTNKADTRCVALADRHYSRQTVGAPSFTRPGYNMVLYYADQKGEAVYAWWRPKFETGESFTQRFDDLECIECTIFRNESSVLSSLLIVEACQVVQTWDRYVECKDGLVTSVNSTKTTKQRSKSSQPGACFIYAGFKPIEHAVGAADVWLQMLDLPEPLEAPLVPKIELLKQKRLAMLARERAAR